MDGWNTREYSWDMTAGITQKSRRESRCKSTTSAGAGATCRPRSTARGRRPTSITFVYNVPQDTGCRAAAAIALTFYDVKPAKFQQIDNFLTFADNVGGASNNVQRRRRHGERASARRHAPGRHQHRQRRRGLVRRGHEAPGVLHLRSLGRHRRRSSTRSSAASGSGRSRSAIASRDGRRT